MTPIPPITADQFKAICESLRKSGRKIDPNHDAFTLLRGPIADYIEGCLRNNELILATVGDSR